MQSKSAFPYRLAAIDLDETLLGPDKQISAANRAAIHALQAQGVRIVLASGRRHENMLKFHRQLELEGAIVSCQGALARNAETDAILHRRCVPADLAARVVADAETRGLTLVYYHLEATYVSQRNAWTELYGQRTGSPVVHVERLSQFDGVEPLKVLWVGAPDYFLQRFAEITAHYREQLEIVVTDPEYMEFMATGVNKALGLAAVADHYGIAREEVLAFGDGHNDVAMLRWAGLGIAMPHGRQSARDAADRVGPGGDPETAFARAVALVFSETRGMDSPFALPLSGPSLHSGAVQGEGVAPAPA